MKSHRHCTGEVLETHEFWGTSVQQALKRVGKWIDKQPPGEGMFVSLVIGDSEGDTQRLLPLPDGGEVIATLTWNRTYR